MTIELARRLPDDPTVDAIDSNPERATRLARHLLARIHRRYETVTESLRIGPLTIRFTRIRQPDRILDLICAEEDQRERTSGVRKSSDDLPLPYWAELWDSAVGLAQFLVERADGPARSEARPRPQTPPLQRWDPDFHVLDLGCGMGLSGTVAAALGATVVLADLEPAALLFARLNTLPVAPRTRIRRIDWRIDRLDQRFDLILGSDVLYDRKQWDFLEPFFRIHLANSGFVVLAEPGRQTGDAFPEWIKSRDWTLERFEQSVAARGKPIRIFRLHPANDQGPWTME